MKLDKPSNLSAGLAGVLALGLFACAEQANPVIPSTPNLPGTQATGGGDAAATQADASPDTEPARTDVTTVAVCDLLRQDCPLHPLSGQPQACYPESGVGRCETIGDGKPAFAPCTVNTDCDRGLACVTPCGLSFPECQYLCDPNADLASTNCASDQVCSTLDSSHTVGICRQPC